MIAGCVAALGTGLVAACDSRGERAAAAAAKASPAPSESTDRPVVLFLGTSLTAGLGLDPEQAYPALIQRKIDSAGFDFRVVNAGVSGETSAGARSRIGWLLRQPVGVLVIETGANDGLRGLSPDALRNNLQAIIEQTRTRQPPPTILLVAMRAPPNLGAAYTSRFQAVYRELAAKNGIPLVPFLLEGVAGIDSLNQSDGIHPTTAGHRRMAETVWKTLEPMLRTTVRLTP